MPKISIITPLHEPGNKYILETYESLLAQTITDWEMIVVENHGGIVPQEMREDKRVFIYKWEFDGIGALKHACCDLCTTPYIVELDNDDLLVRTALEKVLKAFEDGADFVYSDTAEFQDGTWAKQWDGYPYGSHFGWDFYPIEYKHTVLYAMKSPELNPQNLRLIDWSPNHVRAWRKEAYDKIGGHNIGMTVADDHDLIVRMYLAGYKFTHIDECLYLYRVHKDNTVKTNNTGIRNGTLDNYNKYIWKLAEKFADDNKLIKLDLCGGINTPPGYIPIDKHTRNNPKTIYCDLDGPWTPLSTSSVGLLRANDAIEHLRDPIHTMNEAYRVLAPGGFLMIDVPSTNGLGAFCDPTHVSFWNRLSFRYYTQAVFKNFIPAFKGRFQEMRVIEWFPTEEHKRDNVPYIQAQLIALKDNYHPMGWAGC
jgi:O-antigen biosynthesis protein